MPELVPVTTTMPPGLGTGYAGRRRAKNRARAMAASPTTSPKPPPAAPVPVPVVRAVREAMSSGGIEAKLRFGGAVTGLCVVDCMLSRWSIDRSIDLSINRFTSSKSLTPLKSRCIDRSIDSHCAVARPLPKPRFPLCGSRPRARPQANVRRSRLNEIQGNRNRSIQKWIQSRVCQQKQPRRVRVTKACAA